MCFKTRPTCCCSNFIYPTITSSAWLSPFSLSHLQSCVSRGQCIQRLAAVVAVGAETSEASNVSSDVGRAERSERVCAWLTETWSCTPCSRHSGSPCTCTTHHTYSPLCHTQPKHKSGTSNLPLGLTSAFPPPSSSPYSTPFCLPASR